MGRKTKYSDEFKIKVIFEVLKEEKTLAEISSIYGGHKITIRDWKKQFLENIQLAVNPVKGISQYREKIKGLSSDKDELYKQIGKLTSQLDWAKKKSREVGFDS
ncbi:MAG: transposase [Bacteroidetes bacterium]|nr:transposase [Bacteroidota bacterium]